MRTVSSVQVYSPQSQGRRLRWEDEKRVVLIDFLCIPNGTGGMVNERHVRELHVYDVIVLVEKDEEYQ